MLVCAAAPPPANIAIAPQATPKNPAFFALEEGTLRYIGCDLEGIDNDRVSQTRTFNVTLYLECLAGAVQPFSRDLIVSLAGVDVGRFAVTTEGKQPGEAFTISHEVYVPRCVNAGGCTLTAGLVRENAPGEGRRGLTSRMAELARINVTQAPPPSDTTQLNAPEGVSNLVRNGSFEDRFDAWTVAADIVAGAYGWHRVLSLKRDDTTASGGNTSLCIAFGGGQDPDFYHVTQVVPVEPSARYRAEYWVKTEDLESASLPLVSVVDADRAPGEFYRAPDVASLPSGSTDWSRVAFDFTTPPATRRLVVRVSRSGSGPETYDPARFGPIRGTVWFDDIRLIAIADGKGP